jgi:hypothetical protein
VEVMSDLDIEIVTNIEGLDELEEALVEQLFG